MRGDGSDAHPIRELVRKRLSNRYIYPPQGNGAREQIDALDLSDDGSRLVLARGNHSIYTLAASGRGLAPNGLRIVAYFVSETKAGIGTVDAAGGRVRFLRAGEGFNSYGFAPTYSDDGRQIAFIAPFKRPNPMSRREVRSGVWVMRSDGSGAHLVASLPGRDLHNPDFSPDSRRLSFSAPRGLLLIGESREDTYVIDIDGSGLRRVGTGVVQFYRGHPQWTR